MPQPSKIASPSKIPLAEKSPNIISPPSTSPILERPSILGPGPPSLFLPAPPLHKEDPLRTSHLIAPSALTTTTAATTLAGGAKRKLPETGLKPPAAKRMTLADRAAAPKQFAAKPPASIATATRSTNKPLTRNALASTVGPGAARSIAPARGRVVSNGLSKSVGPGVRAGVSRATPAARPPSRGSESSRPPSREGVKEKSATNAKPKRAAWDTKGRLEDMELAYQELKERLEGTTNEKENMNDLLASERARCIFSIAFHANDSAGIGDQSSKITDGKRSTTK